MVLKPPFAPAMNMGTHTCGGAKADTHAGREVGGVAGEAPAEACGCKQLHPRIAALWCRAGG